MYKNQCVFTIYLFIDSFSFLFFVYNYRVIFAFFFVTDFPYLFRTILTLFAFAVLICIFNSAILFRFIITNISSKFCVFFLSLHLSYHTFHKFVNVCGFVNCSFSIYSDFKGSIQLELYVTHIHCIVKWMVGLLNSLIFYVVHANKNDIHTSILKLLLKENKILWKLHKFY